MSAFSEDMEDTGFPNFEYLNLFLQAPDMVKRRLNLTGSARTRIQGLFEAIQEEYDNREDPLSRDSFVLMIKALIMELLVLLTREYRRAIGQPVGQPPLSRMSRPSTGPSTLSGSTATRISASGMRRQWQCSPPPTTGTF